MKTILVLEDEPSLVKLWRHALTLNGYVIWEATNAEDAIRRFLVDANRQIDVLLAGVTLPVSSGILVALVLRAEVPGLRVILTSGNPRAAWETRDAADLERLGPDSVIVLQKPFKNQTLLNSVRELTGAPSAAAGTG
ncbi:MAG TPA: response regulator [Candidatus Acidoferrales bacterium]|nr:response regulator [Candidatus Acidoferrales bacterium]